MSATAVVPIVGQPVLLAVSPVVLALCPCEAKSVMLFSGLNAVSGCQVCGRAWALQGASSHPLGQDAVLLPVATKGGN